MNPFDPKSALLAKHAQHVVLIHFPIALFLTGVVFDIAARFTKDAAKKTTLIAGASLNLLAAAIAVIPTIATGLAAWQWQLEGKKLKGLLLLHLVMGSISGLLICSVAGLRLWRRKGPTLRHSVYSLPLEVLTAIVIALTAHVGGFLSGVNM